MSIKRGLRALVFAEWRQAIATLRGPPSSFQQLRELTERMRAGADMETPQQRLQKIEALEQAAALAHFNDPREQRKRQAAVIRRERRRKSVADIDREIAARAAELKQCGVRNPVTRAEEEIAERRRTTVDALNKQRYRNR